MSYVVATPDAFAAAAQNLTRIGSAVGSANAAAAAPTTSVVAAAQDEVSTAIAGVFGSYAQQFQALSAKAAAFHDQFVQALTGGAASYVEAEAANVLGLMVGDHAGASGAAAALSNAAAATPAADVGDIFGLLGRLIFEAFAKGAAYLAGQAGAAVDEAIRARDAALQIAQAAEQEAREVILEAGDVFRQSWLQQLLTNPTAIQIQEVVGLQLDGSVAAVDSLVGRGEPAAKLIVETIEENVADLIRAAQGAR